MPHPQRTYAIRAIDETLPESVLRYPPLGHLPCCAVRADEIGHWEILSVCEQEQMTWVTLQLRVLGTATASTTTAAGRLRSRVGLAHDGEVSNSSGTVGRRERARRVTFHLRSA